MVFGADFGARAGVEIGAPGMNDDVAAMPRGHVTMAMALSRLSVADQHSGDDERGRGYDEIRRMAGH